MTQEQLEAIQARIKSQSASVQTVRGEAEESDHPRMQEARRLVTRKQRQFGQLSEKTVLIECSKILDKHKRVAFWWRQNTGGMTDRSGQFVKFSFRGAPDLMFVIQGSGRFGACECKSTGKKPTDDQRAFLENVKAAGGAAICCDHPADLLNFLNGL